MRTGFEAMKLGTIIYFVPFFFVLDPGLIMQGEPMHILYVFGCAMLGVVVLSQGLQGLSTALATSPSWAPCNGRRARCCCSALSPSPCPAMISSA